jgi:integrase
MPKNNPPRERRLKKGEFERLKIAAEKSRSWYLWPVVVLAIETAMRRGEILGLRTRANITDLTFHDLRHEAISRMFDNGMKIHEVMAVSGHRTASQLFRYVQMVN